MSARKTPTLAERVQANPFAFITFEETAELFGFGRDVMTALAKQPGFPIVARKTNPALMMEWLKANHAKVGQIKAQD